MRGELTVHEERGGKEKTGEERERGLEEKNDMVDRRDKRQGR